MQAAAQPSLQIRKWRSTDEAFVIRLGTQAFAEYDAYPTLTMCRLVQRGVTWVAWRGNAPAGFAIVHPMNRDSVDLCAIAVEEEVRGLGIGRALLAHVERTAVRAGLKEIRLHTAQSNLSALELFVKCGFRVEQRMPRLYRDMYDACAMFKRVDLARPPK